MRAWGFLLSLILAFAALPAAAAEQPWPAPLEAAFSQAKANMVADPEEAVRFAGEAATLAQKLPQGRQRTLALATARWLAGEAYVRSDQLDKAAPLITQGLQLIKPITEPIKLRGDLMMSLGALHAAQNRAADALDAYHRAHAIFQRLGEKRSRAIALMNIASLYSSANDDGRANDYYHQAADAYSGDPILSLSLHNNAGAALHALRKYAEADAEYEKALEIARAEKNPLLEARVLSNVARNQVDRRLLTEAQATLDRAFALLNSDDSPALHRQMLVTAARVAQEKGDLATAARHIRQAFEGVDIATTGSEYRNGHLYAYQIFSKLGETALALEHLESLKRLSDEAAKVAATTSAALMAAEFNDANQRAQIETMRADELRRTAEFQRTLFLSIGSATLVIIVLLSVALFVIRRSRNQVRDANVVLGETNVALEKALKAKTEFLATTSHEIRTPLNGILGMTQVMLRDPKLDADTRDRIGIVHGAGVTMRSLVDDILDLAKMETGNLSVEALPMDLCATLKEVTRMWEEAARDKGLSFQLHLTHAPHWIVSDSGRMRQIVFNLLSNAIKFTEKGSVSLRAVEEGEGDARRLKLIFADTGIGIPRDKCEEIFESFKQADSGTTRKFGGTGLGLAICRNLAHALGGTIGVESIEGEGSTFTVDLPLVPAEAPAKAEGSTATGTMLIVERNPISRSMLKTLLEPRVGKLIFVGTPDEALTALAEGVDTLVADEATLKAAAGEGDPLAILKELAAAATEANAASIVLWARPDDEMRAALAATGIGKIAEKPLAGPSLIEALVPPAEEKLNAPGSGPLVSHAA